MSISIDFCDVWCCQEISLANSIQIGEVARQAENRNIFEPTKVAKGQSNDSTADIMRTTMTAASKSTLGGYTLVAKLVP